MWLRHPMSVSQNDIWICKLTLFHRRGFSFFTPRRCNVNGPGKKEVNNHSSRICVALGKTFRESSYSAELYCALCQLVFDRCRRSKDEPGEESLLESFFMECVLETLIRVPSFCFYLSV